MNNNSWYSFEHLVSNELYPDVQPYFIAKRNKKNRRFVSSLPKKIRERIVWRNSFKHQALYLKADMFIVTLSYRDILPDIYGDNNRYLKPLIYLQHGTVAIKELQYDQNSYSNSMLRFITYSPTEKALLKQSNGFKDYQLLASVAHPRYKRLALLDNEYKKKNKQDTILWFPTWREHLEGDAAATSSFINNISSVTDSEDLNRFLEDENLTLRICLHQFFDLGVLTKLSRHASSRIEFMHSNDIDVMQELAKARLLITDYSSLGFDFTFLDKPTLFYQFDRTLYRSQRDIYQDAFDEIKKHNSITGEQLVKRIISGKWPINTFFKKRLPRNINLAEVIEGKHIEEMFDNIVFAQRNKVVFVGYCFFGRGGTVSATKSMAEGLMDLGYAVELMSLKGLPVPLDAPGGVIMRCFYVEGRFRSTIVKRLLIPLKRNYSYLKYDSDHRWLIPYTVPALVRFLRSKKAATIVSTRESIHPFLDDAANCKVKNKVFFFHTSPDTLLSHFPGLVDVLRERHFKKAAFVTDSSRLRNEKELGLKNYTKSAVTGNAVRSDHTVNAPDIKAVEEKEVYSCITLARLSSDRLKDIDNIIEFGKYVKSIDDNKVKINIFGAGDAVSYLAEQIDRNDLEDILRYQGLTTEPFDEILEHDCLVDFTENQSFGMIYIESILSGKMCFAIPNTGSKEVLKDIDGALYSSWPELHEKIVGLPSISRTNLVDNYNSISKRYSRTGVARRLSKLLD